MKTVLVSSPESWITRRSDLRSHRVKKKKKKTRLGKVNGHLCYYNGYTFLIKVSAYLLQIYQCL